jgi:prefoldin subunit 5
MKEPDQKDYVIEALRQRIGELVSAYESQIAFLRTEFTMLQKDFDHATKLLEDIAKEKEAVKKFVPSGAAEITSV